MRNLIRILVGLNLVWTAGCSSLRTAVHKDGLNPSSHRIAVFPLRGEYPFGDELADAMVTELIGSGFSVIERAQLRRILDEHRLQWSGSVDTATLLQTGRLAGVNLILVGSVTTRLHVPASQWLFGEGYEREIVDTVNVRWVDVENGRIVASVTLRNGWGGEVEDVARKIIHSLDRTLQANMGPRFPLNAPPVAG